MRTRTSSAAATSPEGSDVLRSLDDLRAEIRERSPLGEARTEEVLRARFERVPRRLELALEHWPLERSRVLDVGCSFGHCLVHFGDRSLGIDHLGEHVDFCRALGLEVVQVDVDSSLEAVPDSAFDYVWVSDIVEHLDSPRLLLRRLGSKLAPEGLLLLHVSTRPSGRIADWTLRRLCLTPYEAHVHAYQFTKDTICYLLARCGYRVEHVVPALPPRLRFLAPLVVRRAPRLFLAARPDPAAEAIVREVEERTRQTRAVHS
jgi:SAM-dependent methyltransferase